MNTISEFLGKIENKRRQADSIQLLSILEEESGYEPKLIGSIIGFGTYHYKYETGLEGDSSVVAFSPRKQNLVIYIMPGFSTYQEILGRLGKHKQGKSCLYINKLTDLDLTVLRELIKRSVNDMKIKYECKAS